MIVLWLAAGVAAQASEAPPVPVVDEPTQGGGPGWKGPKEREYRIYPEYDTLPKKKKRKVTEPETIVLAPDLQVQTGIVPVRPAWDVMAELQQRADDAEQVRRERLRQIALADDEWLMVA